MSIVSLWKIEAEQIVIKNHSLVCGQNLRIQKNFMTMRYNKIEINKEDRVSWRNILRTTTISKAQNCQNANCAFIGNERKIRSLLRLLLLNNLNDEHITLYERQTAVPDYLMTLMIHAIGPRFNGKKTDSI